MDTTAPGKSILDTFKTRPTSATTNQTGFYNANTKNMNFYHRYGSTEMGRITNMSKLNNH